jgi:hypothetical protein
VVVDPDRSARRGRLLKTLGIGATVGGALLLIVGVAGIVMTALGSDPFDTFSFFWMPFVGGFALAGGILAWVGGNLLLRSAEFARGHSSTPFIPVTMPASGSVGWTCSRCGNGNQAMATTCSVCSNARR